MKFRLKGASGAYTGRPFELSAETRIGSGPDCTIRLQDLAVEQARIRYADDVLTLESVADTWVNGEPVTSTVLASGDEIRFGPHRFVLQAPGLRPTNVLPQHPRHVRNRRRWWLAVALLATAAAAAWIWLQPPLF